jgi:hypothetical protein
MPTPITPRRQLARMRNRYRRVTSALWNFRIHVQEHRQQPGGDPLSARREVRLIMLLQWTRQLTSRITGTTLAWPNGEPVAADLALRLIDAALRAVHVADAAATRAVAKGHSRRRTPTLEELDLAERAANVTPPPTLASTRASAEEDAAMWAEFERNEALGIDDD